MNRRKFIKAGIAGGILLGAGGGGIVWLQAEGKKIDVSITTALHKLDELVGKQITATGAWKPYKVLIHCAQSIEFSMSGYPEHKSELFKATAGKLAFSAFHTARKMTHDLTEAIPGAPEIAEDGEINKAINRLRTAYIDFEKYAGQLAPHFAYGGLSKSQYAAAHVMHLYNHLNEIS